MRRTDQTRFPMRAISGAALLVIFAAANPAWAGAKSAAIREAVDYVLRKFGVEAAEELGENAAEILTRRMESLALRTSEEQAVAAVRRVGPRAFRLVEHVADNEIDDAVRLLAAHGNEAAWIVASGRRLGLAARFGDDAARAMMRHKAIAEDLIEHYGDSAVRALGSIDGRNARRLAMLAAPEGELARAAAPRRLLDVIGTHGDRAMDWVWRNKGAIATATVLAAFIDNPQPFIDGTLKVAQIGGDAIVKPALRETARGLSQRPAWLMATLLVFGGIPAWMIWRRLRGIAGRSRRPV